MSLTLGAKEVQSLLEAWVGEISRVLRAKEEVIRLTLAGILSDGHVLVEDVPGVGKTTLAEAIAKTLGLRMTRVQFTADLLPSDLLGVSIYLKEKGQFEFSPGPIFTQILLADELNRASPRTQSALLEAMNERQVSIDGKTHALPAPFLVIATQNPGDFAGTYPLPESQLDRFSVRTSVGYPPASVEIDLICGEGRSIELKQILNTEKLEQLRQLVSRVKIEASVAEYLQELAQATREVGHFRTGASVRALLDLAALSRAWALMNGRDFCLVDDVKAVAVAGLAHRVRLSDQLGSANRREAEQRIRTLLNQLPVPV